MRLVCIFFHQLHVFVQLFLESNHVISEKRRLLLGGRLLLCQLFKFLNH